MTTRDEAPTGDSAVAGTPCGKAQHSTDTDAADPAAPGKHRAQRTGSAGSGPYPIGTDNLTVKAGNCNHRHYMPDLLRLIAEGGVIDTCNYYPDRDGHIAALDDDSTTSSELIQHHLSGAHVIKAFNAMRFDHLREYGREGGAGRRYGIPVAGDDPAAKKQVFDLVEQIGYEPVDAGSLADSRNFQPGTDVYTADLPAEDLRTRIGVQPA
jgi:hypothetical protein